MNVKEVQSLLEKFWETQTSDTEETLLRNYFTSDAIDPEVAYAKSYFANYTNQDDVTSKIIKKLIDKYFEADTTLDEEGLIKEYFSQPKIASDLKIYQCLFNLSNIQSYQGIKADSALLNVVNRLLEKYFNVESTIEEEAVLNQYFSQELVDNSLKQVKVFFNVLQKAKSTTYSKDLTLSKKENIIKLESKNANKRVTLNWWKTAAAAALISAGGYFVTKNVINTTSTNQHFVQSRVNKIEPQTPEEAYEITLQALALVSKKYNKGQEEILDGMKSFQEATDLSN
jgi:hypothetical protein